MAAETGQPLTERLGPPERCAAELRAAAGVGSGPGGASPSLVAAARRPAALVSTVDSRLGPLVGQVRLRDFRVLLRPAWWVLRGYLLTLVVVELVVLFSLPVLHDVDDYAHRGGDGGGAVYPYDQYGNVSDVFPYGPDGQPLRGSPCTIRTATRTTSATRGAAARPRRTATRPTRTRCAASGTRWRRSHRTPTRHRRRPDHRPVPPSARAAGVWSIGGARAESNPCG